MFHAFTGVICLYIVVRLVPALPLPMSGKCLVVLAVMAASQVHLINRLYSGNLASPEVPFAVVVALGWLFGAMVLLAVFLLLKDVGAVLLFVLGKATGLRLALPL
ncbi:MAG: metallophosphoesterase, partial [Zoogloeaceae bacterium]|nr:metallophosphoesterase [Zoogloeaceae bacterium]